MVDKPPSFCRLCDIALASPEVWRQHLKSEWHVYNLRLRVAEPGTIVPPPPSSEETLAEAETSVSLDDDSDESDEELPTAPEFSAEQCLFCGKTVDDNIAHMAKAHSFVVPYQDHLTADLETLLWYLHLVIYGHRECILCGTRCSTVEGIQHHMTAKGHCRFNLSSGTAEFYDFAPSECHDLGVSVRADDDSLRLPSGKHLSRRAQSSGPAAPRKAHKAAERRLGSTTLPSATPIRGSELATAQTNNTPAASCAQLARLSRGDQRSLAHLPSHEVRSLIALSARHVDQSRRQETHEKLKLETAGNITLTAHFRHDTSKRFRGPWG